MSTLETDRLVVGAGLFGLYAAWLLAERDFDVAVVDLDPAPMMRASFSNQARVHHGYHYPRSLFTALQSAHYYERFAADFPDAIKGDFEKIYAIARAGSYTDSARFSAFCRALGVECESIDPSPLFQDGSVTAAFRAHERAFDATIVRERLVERLDATGRATWLLGNAVERIERAADGYRVTLGDGRVVDAGGIVNATYAGTNGILSAAGLEALSLKYELCEVALAVPPIELRNVGVTIMDGAFCSLMPFGHSGMHTLTTVGLTPRVQAAEDLPRFSCQALNPRCAPGALDNCALCEVRPRTAWALMRQLAVKFLRHADSLVYRGSLYSVKTVLQTAEVDDARPTVLIVHDDAPPFVTVLSGKVNTLYDLEEVL